MGHRVKCFRLAESLSPPVKAISALKWPTEPLIGCGGSVRTIPSVEFWQVEHLKPTPDVVTTKKWWLWALQLDTQQGVQPNQTARWTWFSVLHGVGESAIYRETACITTECNCLIGFGLFHVVSNPLLAATNTTVVYCHGKHKHRPDRLASNRRG